MFACIKRRLMEEVEEAQVLSIPHVLQLDSRYRQLYQLYRLLKMKSYLLHLIPITTTIGNEHIYCMKFGVLQLIDGLQQETVGFEVVKGWIFDMKPNSKTIQVPFRIRNGN